MSASTSFSRSSGWRNSPSQSSIYSSCWENLVSCASNFSGVRSSTLSVSSSSSLVGALTSKYEKVPFVGKDVSGEDFNSPDGITSDNGRGNKSGTNSGESDKVDTSVKSKVMSWADVVKKN